MGRKLACAIDLYVHGVADGHTLAAADKYLASGCVDHTATDIDAMRGFLATYEPLVRRYADRFVRPFRGFEDGTKVFLHSYVSFGRGQVSHVVVDVFDTDDDDDHITARWHLTVPVVSPTRTGRGQIDGPTQVSGLEHTDANRNLVRQFIADVLIDGRKERVEAYLDPDDYAEHSPDIADGSRGFRHHLDTHAARGTPVRYHELSLIVGCGNYAAAATLSTATVGTQPYRVFDVYRLDRGRIVEHWDAAVVI